MWHDLFDAGITYGEKAVRTVVVYLALIVLLRLVGKRGLAQLNTLDLVVMLLLSNVVQNAVIGEDNSLSGGLFGAAVLMAANSLLVRYAARSDWLTWLFEGSPSVLARNGAYDERQVRRLGLRRADLDVAVRHQGGDGIAETKLVVLEPGGTMVVDLLDGDQTADKNDIAALREQLDRLQLRLDRLAAEGAPASRCCGGGAEGPGAAE
ncbi:DUF421 domain-containing protein [Streptomyces sp. NBC_00503]|uniref:DUF421 domain-containing protein n=1 Tax=Streptomyces sp. NBC_00503 TaxID=2903659 RepID=UPI002E819250|nr:YetF domain-containing protein [Streptomyces sp. NBC_00503]WUD79362.1 DUF421 domain-containing protein [Streptomyces sp. NBC_00503]